MFSNAYKLACEYTRPVVVSTRRFDGRVEAQVGAYVVLNRDGWVATAAHLFEAASVHASNSKDMADHRGLIEAIEMDPRLSSEQRRRKKKKLRGNPDWVQNFSMWWGQDSLTLEDVRLVPNLDLAVGRLEPFDPSSVSAYPILKDPTALDPGTSLCKLGYPFHSISATFDESANSFVFGAGALPIPRFPIDGIFTRNIELGPVPGVSFSLQWIETSSPGLRGQSGGPIFDVQGTVWGIQVKTIHLDLGFAPTLDKGAGKSVVENQFLNVGVGVHPVSLSGFLTQLGIQFQLSPY
jgi:hypothetical protein